MTATAQDTLFDVAPPTPHKTHTHDRAPRRSKYAIETPCDPTCVLCGNPEPPQQPDRSQLCPATPGRRCATLCAHTDQPYKADLCLVLTHTPGQIVTSPHSGHTLAAVTCPHCARTHWHAPTPGTHYRIAGCGKPYIVHLAEGDPRCP